MLGHRVLNQNRPDAVDRIERLTQPHPHQANEYEKTELWERKAPLATIVMVTTDPPPTCMTS
jgi:hypothetical protein